MHGLNLTYCISRWVNSISIRTEITGSIPPAELTKINKERYNNNNIIIIIILSTSSTFPSLVEYLTNSEGVHV